ncbi:hypothetical protein BDV32DRAFT_120478 [Aspergillus pseudonomiae]|nr:hypothetical protein BDV32DRAFT_120478 [Aspergillus pseudonomiae]
MGAKGPVSNNMSHLPSIISCYIIRTRSPGWRDATDAPSNLFRSDQPHYLSKICPCCSDPCPRTYFVLERLTGIHSTITKTGD